MNSYIAGGCGRGVGEGGRVGGGRGEGEAEREWAGARRRKKGRERGTGRERGMVEKREEEGEEERRRWAIVSADVFILYVGLMPGDGRQRAEEHNCKENNKTTNYNQAAPERFRMVF